MTPCEVSTVLGAVALVICGFSAADVIRRYRWMARSNAAAQRVYALQRAKDDVVRDALEAWECGDREAVTAGLAALDAGRGDWVAAMADWERVNASAPGGWLR